MSVTNRDGRIEKLMVGDGTMCLYYAEGCNGPMYLGILQLAYSVLTVLCTWGQ